MESLKILSPAEQLAAYLRQELLRGHWRQEVPGAPALAKSLGLDHRTVIAAYTILEREGYLVSQGAGKRRRVADGGMGKTPTLRLELLLYEEEDKQRSYTVDLLHRLMDMGHVARLAPKTLQDLGMDENRVARMVEKSDADAWIVMAGSKNVLEWFASQKKPAMAFAGRRRGIDMASVGPDKVPAMREAVRRLVSHGHRRIAMLTHEERRKPDPGTFEKEFLLELGRHGLPTGRYNLPDWRPDYEDFHRCVASLFRHTPPSALLVDGMPLFIAAQQHLAQLGILAPRDVSMVCTDPDLAFSWCRPTVAHIAWEAEPMVSRIVRWADTVARGGEDRRPTFTKAEFINGETVGPAPRKGK